MAKPELPSETAAMNNNNFAEFLPVAIGFASVIGSAVVGVVLAVRETTKSKRPRRPRR